MVLTILKWVGAAMILSLVALWLWQGGYWKIAEYASIIPNPLYDATSTTFLLPGQEPMWEVPDTIPPDYGESDYQYPSDELANSQQTQTHGGLESRSPYEGYVTLQAGNPWSEGSNDEYLIVRTGNSLLAPIDISGWSLQSALSGERVVIPLAASPFVQGVINSVRPIILTGGESVIIVSGTSPIGVSFRETNCTGYLAQTQDFQPALANACSRPTDLLPRTTENESRYGTNCLDFVERLPQCSYPTALPATLTSACRTYLANTFTYNGCMQSYQSRAQFNLNVWRVYLASGRELWRNSHDVIRLLDDKGRVVGSLSY